MSHCHGSRRNAAPEIGSYESPEIAKTLLKCDVCYLSKALMRRCRGCRHYFCHFCVKKWRQESRVCPMRCQKSSHQAWKLAYIDQKKILDEHHRKSVAAAQRNGCCIIDLDNCVKTADDLEDVVQYVRRERMARAGDAQAGEKQTPSPHGSQQQDRALKRKPWSACDAIIINDEDNGTCAKEEPSNPKSVKSEHVNVRVHEGGSDSEECVAVGDAVWAMHNASSYKNNNNNNNNNNSSKKRALSTGNKAMPFVKEEAADGAAADGFGWRVTLTKIQLPGAQRASNSASLCTSWEPYRSSIANQQASRQQWSYWGDY